MNSGIEKGNPDEDLGNPNEDGCVLGTAGRDEDPNQCAGYPKPDGDSNSVQTPEDARGMPGYPRPKDSTKPETNSETPVDEATRQRTR